MKKHFRSAVRQPAITLKGINAKLKEMGVDAEIVRSPAPGEGEGFHAYSAVSSGKKDMRSIFCRRMAEYSEDFWIDMARTYAAKAGRA